MLLYSKPHTGLLPLHWRLSLWKWAVYLRERGFNILLLSDKAVLDRKHLVPGGQRQLTERKRMEITSIERLKAVKLVVLNRSPAPAYPSVASALQQHISRVC